jgi:hypothetical protein
MQKFKFQPKSLKSKRVLTDEDNKAKHNTSVIIKNNHKEKNNNSTLSNNAIVSINKYDNIIVDMLKLHSDKTKSREISPSQSSTSNLQVSSHYRCKSKSMNEENRVNFLSVLTSPKTALVNLDLNREESSEFTLIDE